jgi:hypothetical protein
MEMEYPKWQRQYEALLMEVDPQKLAALVEEIETAMFYRYQELSTSSDGHDERHALAEAAISLLVVQKEILGFPRIEFIDQKGVPGALESE